MTIIGTYLFLFLATRIGICQNIWSKVYLNVQAAPSILLGDDNLWRNVDLTEENGENYLHLKLYPVTNHVLSSNFFIDEIGGNRKIYPDPNQIFQFYTVFHENKHSGMIVEDKEDNTMHGTIEIDDEQYLLKSSSAEEGSKNIYLLNQVAKMHNVLPNDPKDYIEIKDTASKLVKKAKTTDTNTNFKGPYYIEAMFYIDPSNMTLTENELISIAAQVDHILREASFENEAYFVLKGIQDYKGPAIRSQEDLKLFCDYTADARAKKLEDVFFPIIKSKCHFVACQSVKYREAKWEILDMFHCNLSNNHLSESRTGAVCYMGQCVPKNTIEAKAGSWGQWTTSPCKGDDFIGFRERARKCDKPRPKFSGKYCPGDKIEYKVCRNKASRNNKSNTALCKGHDPSSIYETHDDYPCDLICSNEGEYTIYGKVADGTLIKTENTLDMCLNGVKTPIGCDDEFFSTAKRDKCGICNGDNSTCVPFETEEEIILTKATTNITNLKEGTTFLLFRLTLGYYEGFDGVGNSIGKERKGKERKGKERKGKERKGKERKGKERKGKERKGKERKGKERKGKERKGKERKGKERKGKKRKMAF
ncbi:unnamed protein product [Gordionus sp. m RMFG-2023]